MNVEQTDSSEMIMKEFEKLVEAARLEYPELSDQMETFASCEVEMQSFREYLDLVQETPAVVTANSAR